MSGRLHSLLAAIILLMASAAWADGAPQAELQGEPVGGIGGELTSLAFDRDGTLWIGSRYAGIFVYRQGKFFVHNAYNTPVPDEGISAVYVDAKNVKWFGSERGYLYSFDGKRWQVFAASQGPRDSIGAIRCIRSDGNGSVWFTADYGPTGLFRVEKGKIESISPNVKSGADGRVGVNGPGSRTFRMTGRVPKIDVDRHGHLWVACHLGFLCFNGQDWTRPADSQTQQLEIGRLWCDPTSDAIYLVAVGVDRTENPFGLPTYKTYSFKDGRSQVVTDQMPKSGIAVLRVERDGRFAGYIAPHGPIAGDRQQMQRYFAGTPLGNEAAEDIAFDKQGRVWFATRFKGLCCLDNGKWTTFAPPERDDLLAHPFPRPAWQKRPLQDLVREEPIDADIHTVLKDPRRYADKKIRIVGTTASSFEYAEVIDAQGKGLGMWPKHWAAPQTSYRVAKRPGEKTEQNQLEEYLGYLEWGGYFGHMGGARMQFTIVESYPANASQAEKTKIKKQRLEELEKASYDWPISEWLDNAAVRAMRERLQGAWILMDVQGDFVALRGGKGASWVIAGDRLTTGSPGYRTRGTLRLDPSHTPAWIDFYSSDKEPFAAPRSNLKGIFSLDGDKLRVCFSAGGNNGWPRPRQFASDRDYHTYVFTLARDRNWTPPAATTPGEPDDPDCIAALRKSYTRLELDERGNAVAADFGYIQVHGYHKTTDAEIAPLRGLHSLERVELNGGELTDAGLASLAHCQRLVSLRVAGNDITDAGLEHLRGLIGLEELGLYDTNITDAGLARLKDLKQLRSLTFSSLAFRGRGLDALSGCAELQFLSIAGPKVTDDVWQSIAHFPALKKLHLSETTIGDSHAENLAACTNLEELRLDNTRFGDRGMTYLRNLHKLKVLSLTSTPITDLGMESLKHSDSLEMLLISNTRVGDEGLRHLNGLKNLNRLFLDKTQVGDAGLESLTDLPNLQCLFLTDAPVTSAGLRSLSRLPKLEQLYLDNTRVDNDGLEYLKSFPKLRAVSLTGPRVTRDAAETLAKELPKVGVTYDHGNVTR